MKKKKKRIFRLPTVDSLISLVHDLSMDNSDFTTSSII